MELSQYRVRPGEQGFALVLAILSLMLLTFLGLTLATTTSTELQIATNYRWSQQAQYNAEAGLEAARIILSGEANVTSGWDSKLPAYRPGPWFDGSAPPPGGGTGRDYHKSTCDTRGGVGYGLVLTDSTTRYEDVSSYMGETLHGAFTIWIRRNLNVDNLGQYSDSDRNDALVIVSEGRAPFSGPADTFTANRQAVRVLETSFTLGLSTSGNPCLGLTGQEGLGPTGENFNPCAPINDSVGTLQGAFGSAGSGGTGALTSDTTVQ